MERALFEIVRLVDLRRDGESGCALLVSTADPYEQLCSELSVQTGLSLARIEASELSPSELLEELRQNKAPVILVTGLGAWADESFRVLDISRSRLDMGAFLVFCLSQPGAVRFMDQAPNLRSWIASHIFTVIRDGAEMSGAEIEDRLAQLRNHYHLSDDDVVQRATDGSLSGEPEFAEWLVLVGRGDLIR